MLRCSWSGTIPRPYAPNRVPDGRNPHWGSGLGVVGYRGLIHERVCWRIEHCVGALGVGTLVVKPRRHVVHQAELTVEEAAEPGVGRVAFGGRDRGHRQALVVAQPAGSARPGLVGQSVDAAGQEPSPPLTDLMLVRSHHGGDAPQRQTLGAQQDDLGPPGCSHRRGVSPSPALPTTSRP